MERMFGVVFVDKEIGHRFLSKNLKCYSALHS